MPKPLDHSRDLGGPPTEADRPLSRGETPTEDLAGASTEPALGDRTLSVHQSRTEPWSNDPGKRTLEYPAESETDASVGTTIRYLGDYELLDVAGRGGMGVVYRARQISLNRIVALKLIRLDGSASEPELRRFREEAEAIASLDHPSIVPIYEVGTHEGRHYFSMKLITGESLQRAIPRLRHDFRAIGTIVAGAARAVQHAHERGILHRDIKPANILLDPDDHPHVTDFGLAKRIDSGDPELTRTGAVLGTPAYMAPEQATATRGSITIATDVYGLGAVLYALLSGHAPHRGSSMLEVLDAVREHDPDPPSKSDAGIPRDLEVICRKCLEKDPRRRYPSARELADDLDRWLDGRPIAARRVGPVTRAVMWCKRKPIVAGLAAALLITALVGAAGILLNWREVRRQRDQLARANAQVRSEWEASRQLNEFLVSDLLAGSSPFLAGRRDVPVSSLLDRSAALASARFVGRPKLEGSIRQAIGQGYLDLGMLPRAEAELLHAARLRESLPDGDELDRLSSEYVLARLRLEQGWYVQAEAHARKALEGRRQQLGETDVATLQAAELLGAVLKLKGQVEAARTLLVKVAVDARESLGHDHPVTLHARTDLAVIAHDQGRFDEAFRSFEQLVPTSGRVFGPDHPETLFARSRLGMAALSLRRPGQAEEILKAIVDPARDVLGPEHPETLQIIANLAAVRAELGQHEAAAKGIEEAIQGQRAALPSDHLDILRNEINRLVISLRNQGNPAEALPQLQNLIARMRARLEPDDPELGKALASIATVFWDLDRNTEARAYVTDAIAILEKHLAPEDPVLIGAKATRAAINLALGEYLEAEKDATVALEARSRPGAVDSPWRLGTVQSVLGGALAGQKKFDRAEPLLLEGFQSVDADPRAPPRRVAEALDRLIRFYETTGHPEKAETWRARKPTPKPKPGA